MPAYLCMLIFTLCLIISPCPHKMCLLITKKVICLLPCWKAIYTVILNRTGCALLIFLALEKPCSYVDLSLLNLMRKKIKPFILHIILEEFALWSHSTYLVNMTRKVRWSIPRAAFCETLKSPPVTLGWNKSFCNFYFNMLFFQSSPWTSPCPRFQGHCINDSTLLCWAS